METLLVDGWTVRHDRAATVAYYQTIAQGDADRCGCSYCRNYAFQRATAFPADFRLLLEQLGIPAGKEHEVYELGPAGDAGFRLYGGWFLFVGDFARTEPRSVAAYDPHRFGFGFTNSFPRPEGMLRDAVSAVAFGMPLPWLLLDEDPD